MVGCPECNGYNGYKESKDRSHYFMLLNAANPMAVQIVTTFAADGEVVLFSNSPAGNPSQ